MGNYVTPEEVKHAKEIDLLTYLQLANPQELVRVGNERYTTKTHDSVSISNGLWKRWSTGDAGKSAVDYLIKVEGYSFQNAVQMVNQARGGVPVWDVRPIKPSPAPKKQLQLPEKNNDNLRAVNYLKSRGIHANVISHCIHSGTVFEEKKTHNVVFVGLDKQTPKYAFKRGTCGKDFKREAAGSDKKYNFCVAANPNADTLHVYESAIDALSYCSLGELVKGNWKQDFHLSQGGVAPAALEQFLADHPNINKVYLRYDNDVPGQEAAVKTQRLLLEKYGVAAEIKPPRSGKDYNEFLQDFIPRFQKKMMDGKSTPARKPPSPLPVAQTAKKQYR